MNAGQEINTISIPLKFGEMFNEKTADSGRKVSFERMGSVRYKGVVNLLH